MYNNAINGKKTDDVVIDSFVKLAEKKNFDPKWTDAFLDSMESDIKKSKYETIQETIDYMYGSAEVIGLYMARIMDLKDEALVSAKYLGRSMQYINFIRDIADDIKLGRTYMPAEEMRKFGIKTFDYDYVRTIPEKFNEFIKKQLSYYCNWQKKAEEGYKFIPKRYLIPIKTASEMYNWTAEQIYNNPFVIYQKKVKPQISQIISTTILNIVDPHSKNRNRTKPGINHQITPQLNCY
jgi:phytoene synthase